jgi:hypothetical protein
MDLNPAGEDSPEGVFISPLLGLNFREGYYWVDPLPPNKDAGEPWPS